MHGYFCAVYRYRTFQWVFMCIENIIGKSNIHMYCLLPHTYFEATSVVYRMIWWNDSMNMLVRLCTIIGYCGKWMNEYLGDGVFIKFLWCWSCEWDSSIFLLNHFRRLTTSYMNYIRVIWIIPEIVIHYSVTARTLSVHWIFTSSSIQVETDHFVRIEISSTPKAVNLFFWSNFTLLFPQLQLLGCYSPHFSLCLIFEFVFTWVNSSN